MLDYIAHLIESEGIDCPAPVWSLPRRDAAGAL